MHCYSLIAAAGWADALSQSDGEGALLSTLLVFLSFGAVGVLAYLLLQRFAELITGQWRTTIREIMVYTFLVALLCALLLWIGRILGDGDPSRFFP
jgi:hypothetical protein